ncbi:methyltransferase domain-containing protein [Pseudidiomarina sp. GXY010]|uniref:Methyltransferase domain-containing protein n=1 Tax=Pseudidiomarina fusca TaxID=2965078 RepID=A0ABU3KTR0_9GAMM|nr:methyltransferase domain-containing protein [Pseudidiomarina sp. GXY010]MDT7524567.1 methyltransferase domain-containing protein [Pseudidiomarina sp. GXY010]
MWFEPALRPDIAAGPTDWQQLVHGIWLREQIEQQLDPHLTKMFGYHFVRVGQLAQQLQLTQIRIGHELQVAKQLPAEVLADTNHWPFAEHSLDAILMVAELEFERDPHQVLREMSRSLIADGYLILVGFNPFSPALLPGLWPGRGDRFPWCGRYFSKARINDWLALLNFEIITSEYFVPSLFIERLNPANSVLQRLYQWFPQLGSMYLVVARKREMPLTLTRQRAPLKAKLKQMPVANRVE